MVIKMGKAAVGQGNGIVWLGVTSSPREQVLLSGGAAWPF